jgi:hypothetical protein
MNGRGCRSQPYDQSITQHPNKHSESQPSTRLWLSPSLVPTGIERPEPSGCGSPPNASSRPISACYNNAHGCTSLIDHRSPAGGHRAREWTGLPFPALWSVDHAASKQTFVIAAVETSVLFTIVGCNRQWLPTAVVQWLSAAVVASWGWRAEVDVGLLDYPHSWTSIFILYTF